MLRKTKSRRMSSRAIVLAMLHATVLLHSARNVRPFTPRSKRFELPKFSNLEVKHDRNNNGDVGSGSDADPIRDDGGGNNSTTTPTVIAKRRSSSPLPTNTVTPSMTTAVAPLSKKIPSKERNNKNKNNNNNNNNSDRKMDLMWCQSDRCQDSLRERVVGDHNAIVFNGPATGQVAYRWNKKAYPIDGRHADSTAPRSSRETKKSGSRKAPPFSTVSMPKIASVLLLVKRDDESLYEIAARKVPELTEVGIDVLMAPELAAKLKHYHGVDNERIHLFEQPKDPNKEDWKVRHVDDDEEEWIRDMNYETFPDLICTLGGDGLLLYASSIFQGPIPPLLAISGGSLGFLTAFSEHEMTDAIRVALGVATRTGAGDAFAEGGDADEDALSSAAENGGETGALQVFPPNMLSYPYEPLVSETTPRFTFGYDDHICMTIRMRLDCRIVNREGVVRARYNVLNEVVIDRGGSPYLAALECFCDDVHLTTVQADGVIFATPSGSTAYSMSAGGSVVHPAVPCILVTPICPHVLSFRSMVFPDHVVLRCFVPDDARSAASVAFDGKHRTELGRGDSVQIRMSAYPFPTINKGDHSSDWLESLKNSFNFNTRPRQKPL